MKHKKLKKLIIALSIILVLFVIMFSVDLSKAKKKENQYLLFMRQDMKMVVV